MPGSKADQGCVWAITGILSSTLLSPGSSTRLWTRTPDGLRVTSLGTVTSIPRVSFSQNRNRHPLDSSESTALSPQASTAAIQRPLRES